MKTLHKIRESRTVHVVVDNHVTKAIFEVFVHGKLVLTIHVDDSLYVLNWHEERTPPIVKGLKFFLKHFKHYRLSANVMEGVARGIPS